MGNVIQFPVDARARRFREDALGAKLGRNILRTCKIASSLQSELTR